MGLVDEFEKWLIEEMLYDSEWAYTVTRKAWNDNLLKSSNCNEDVEAILDQMLLFALQKVFKDEELDEFKFEHTVMSDVEYGYMEGYILEMRTRTVVAHVEGDPARITPKELEDMLRDLIEQTSESKRLLTVRLTEIS